METSEEQQQRAKILIEQADRLLAKLPVDISEVAIRDLTQEPWRSTPSVVARAEDAYDRLTQAQKRIKDRTVWDRTKEEVSGRTGDDIMQCLHELHEEIKPFHKG